MRIESLGLGRALLAATLIVLVVMAGCSGWLGEGIDPRALPDDVRADYDLFAQRCSKCHSLARPLSSGIDDDDYWVMYVARMRRQPGSGISQDDTVVILRFLHYYSGELQKKKKEKLDPQSASPSASAHSAPMPLQAIPLAPGSQQL
jgi:hypothetical protein